MEHVSFGAFIERKAEKEQRALEALERAIATLANEMKVLRRATDRCSATMSTAVAATSQLRSSFTEISLSVTAISQSLHRIEHNTNRSVAFSPFVFSSAISSHLPVPIAPHLHFPQPAIPSFTGSVQPHVPQIAIFASTTTEQIRHSRTNRINRLPLPTVNSSWSSTSSSFTASTSENFPQTAITSCNTSEQPHPDRITSSASTATHTQQPLNEIPHFPTLIERQTVSSATLLVHPPPSPPPSPTFSSHFHCLPPSKLFLHTIEAPEEEPVIMEDLSEEEQVIVAGHYCGLYNLGNTCYMNSTM